MDDDADAAPSPPAGYRIADHSTLVAATGAQADVWAPFSCLADGVVAGLSPATTGCRPRHRRRGPPHLPDGGRSRPAWGPGKKRPAPVVRDTCPFSLAGGQKPDNQTQHSGCEVPVDLRCSDPLILDQVEKLFNPNRSQPSRRSNAAQRSPGHLNPRTPFWRMALSRLVVYTDRTFFILI